mmetsp:Transcript_25730/g.56057  ORF Transcript_25730/g.56057 Transcript_25730/m.56057 type:complete len:212 (-) Transcript_25730:1095-1730(-)
MQSATLTAPHPTCIWGHCRSSNSSGSRILCPRAPRWGVPWTSMTWATPPRTCPSASGTSMPWATSTSPLVASRGACTLSRSHRYATAPVACKWPPHQTAHGPPASPTPHTSRSASRTWTPWDSSIMQAQTRSSCRQTSGRSWAGGAGPCPPLHPAPGRRARPAPCGSRPEACVASTPSLWPHRGRPLRGRQGQWPHPGVAGCPSRPGRCTQ